MINMAPEAAMTPPRKSRLRKISKVNSGSSRRFWRRVNKNPPMTQAMKAAATRIQERLGFASSLIASVSPVSVINAKIEEIRSQCLVGLGIFGGASREIGRAHV